jgi:hypothetical protein
VGVDARNVGDRVRRSGTRLPREGENAAGEEERRDDECRWESFIHAGKPRCLLRDVARRFRTDAKCVPSLKRAKREIESSNIRKNWSKPQKRNHMFRSCSLLGQQYGFSICRSRVHLARRTEGATCSNVDERDFGGMLLIVGFATRIAAACIAVNMIVAIRHCRWSIST